HPDVFGLPIWEFFMWGFLVLHLVRMVKGPVPQWNPRLVLPLTIVFAAPFSLVTDPAILLFSSGLALGLALFFFHDSWDLRYVAYNIFLGGLFEYVGV